MTLLCREQTGEGLTQQPYGAITYHFGDIRLSGNCCRCRGEIALAEPTADSDAQSLAARPSWFFDSGWQVRSTIAGEKRKDRGKDVSYERDFARGYHGMHVRQSRATCGAQVALDVYGGANSTDYGYPCRAARERTRHMVSSPQGRRADRRAGLHDMA
jgi:hypothetical protein